MDKCPTCNQVVSQWFELEKVKPYEGQEVRIFDVRDPQNKQIDQAFYYDDGRFMDGESGVYSDEWWANDLPTHWCPEPDLPPRPKALNDTPADTAGK